MIKTVEQYLESLNDGRQIGCLGEKVSDVRTHYTERVENYRKLLQRQDLALTGAITDVKGDRSLHPSKQKQHPDYYLRIVDRRKDGIVVRGAKVHISATPCANEALCLPCRTHGEEDKDYALSFAIPLNAPGIKLLAVEPVSRTYEEEGEFDYPKTSELQPTECLIVFDDVFVPWERVFMCGEWQFSRHLAYAFASYHRLFGTCKMIGKLEIITGAAALVAEYNGVEKVPHVRRKLA